MKELPSVSASKQDWQHLSISRRITWALRLLLFLGIVITIFLPWYQDDLAAWQIGLGFAYLSCGMCFVPYLALLIFGLWSILLPGGQMIWAYRVTLLGWIAYSGVMFAIYDGPIAFLTVALSAVVIEIADIVVVRRNPEERSPIVFQNEQQIAFNQESGIWICPKCQHSNDLIRYSCLRCDFERD